MGGMATSGGYYIAAACDKIVANPGTLTGSIGVIMQLTNVEELMKKVGVKGLNIKSGANKDLGSPFQAISPEGREILQSLVDNVHSQFVAAVAKGRGMDEGQVRKLADGRVYSGAQAKDLGLIDQFGTLEDAIELAAKRAGSKASPRFIIPVRNKSAGGSACLWGCLAVDCREPIAVGSDTSGHRRSFNSARRHL